MQEEKNTIPNDDVIEFDDAMAEDHPQITEETLQEDQQSENRPAEMKPNVLHNTEDTVLQEDVEPSKQPQAMNVPENQSSSEDAEEPTVTFSSFGFCPEIMQALNEAGFREPTPIQVKAIPSVMDGRDVIGQALTGTGKTAAFGLPTMQKIMNEPGLNLLVLVPTRELAAQVSNELFKLGRYANIHTAAFTGGQSYSRQETILAKGINALVATPGRLLDLIDSGHFDDVNPKHIVVDEADEMLDMGFLEDVKKIFEHFNGEHQTMLFSATMPRPVIQLAEHILKDPVNITTSIAESTNNDIEQLFYVIEDHERADAVIRLIDAENVTKGMIFCRTKEETDSLNILLSARGYNVNCLHGDMEQAQRSRVMAAFRRGEIDILVATDVAARGLDVDDVSHVFNYHLPFDSRGYVHRIGRTGRAGKAGTAITLVTPREMRQLDAIRRNVGAQMQNRLVPTRTQVTEQRLKKIFHDVHDYKLDMDILSQVETLSVNQDLLVIIAKLLAHQLASCGDKGPEEIGPKGQKLERILSRSERKDRSGREEREDRGGHGRRSRERGSRGDRDNRSERGDRGGRRQRREYDAWAKEEDFGENEAPARQKPGNLDRPSYAENAPNMREEPPVRPEREEKPERRFDDDRREREEKPERRERRFDDDRRERDRGAERRERRFDDDRRERRYDDDRPRYTRDGKVNLREASDHAPRKGKWEDKFQDRGPRQRDYDRPAPSYSSFSAEKAKKPKRNLPPPPPTKSKRDVPPAPKDSRKSFVPSSKPKSGKDRNWYFN